MPFWELAVYEVALGDLADFLEGLVAMTERNIYCLKLKKKNHEKQKQSLTKANALATRGAEQR